MSAFLDYSTAGATARNPLPMKVARDPTTSDVIAPGGEPMNVGRIWVNSITKAIFIYAGGGTWDNVSGGSETFTALTVNGPSMLLGTNTLTGTTNINTTGSAVTSIGTGGTGAVNIGNATGNTAVTGTLTASGNISATNGNLSLLTAGNKVVIATGANASVGISGAMSGSPGAVTVATTASSTTALIFYSRKTTGGTPGQVSITAQDGTGFTLTSTGNETSTFNWWIINA